MRRFYETDPLWSRRCVGALQRLMKFVLGKRRPQGSGSERSFLRRADARPHCAYDATKATRSALPAPWPKGAAGAAQPGNNLCAVPPPAPRTPGSRGPIAGVCAAGSLPGTAWPRPCGHCAEGLISAVRRREPSCTARLPMPVLMPIIARQQKRWPRGSPPKAAALYSSFHGPVKDAFPADFYRQTAFFFPQGRPPPGRACLEQTGVSHLYKYFS